MGFLDSVVIPGSTASKAAPNIPQSKSTGFLSTVKLPSDPARDRKLQTLRQEEAISTKKAQEANSFTGLAKQTAVNIFDMGAGLVKGLAEPFVNPSELTQSLEQDIPGILKPIEVPVLRAVMPMLEPFLTDATASIVFNTPALNDAFSQEAAKGSFSPTRDTVQSRAGQSLISATQKTPVQIVGDTAQAVLSVYTPRLVGSGTAAFASKPILNAITQTVKEGAAYGFTFGTAQVASSGTTDPKEIATILAHATVGGAVFNLAVAGTLHGVFKSLPHAISELNNSTRGQAKTGGFLESVEMPNKLNVEHLPSEYDFYTPPNKLPVIDAGPGAPRGDLPVIDLDTGRTTAAPRSRVEPVAGAPEPSILITDPGRGGRVREVKPVGTGDTKLSTLAEKVNARAVEEGLTEALGDLPEYQVMNIAEQARLATDLVASNPRMALQIARGERLPPPNLHPEAVFKAIEDAAIRAGDVETLQALATGNLSTQASAMGQRIRLLGERTPDSPVTIIREVTRAREANIETKTGVTYERAKAVVASDIKQEIKKSAPSKETWADFIKSLECGY